jgi:hypothetical protein
MAAEMRVKLEKVKKICGILRGIFLAAMVFLVLEFVVAAALLIADRGIDFSQRPIALHVMVLSLWRRLHMVVMIGISEGLIFTCLYNLRRLFGNFSQREIFSQDSTRRLRAVGVCYAMWSFVSFLSLPIAYVTVHPANPYTATLNPEALVIGACTVVISLVMDVAAEMREENELTI